MAYEELFLDLLRAEREEDITDALTIFGLEKFSDSNWIPYGGFENNFGIIGAQQADAIGALVEKVVNSIDAVLMRECFARNLDPRSNPTSAIGWPSLSRTNFGEVRLGGGRFWAAIPTVSARDLARSILIRARPLQPLRRTRSC